MASIAEHALSSVVNMDKGFLFNFKTLFKNPKKIIMDYVNGKRRVVLNPISYLIFSITVYLILMALLKSLNQVNDIHFETKNIIQQKSYSVGIKIGKFIWSYMKYFWVLSIFPLALSLRLTFKKYNYPEHLAISAFIIGHATIIGMISYLIIRIPLLFDPIVYSVMFWLIFKIFGKQKDRIDSIMLTFTALLLFFIQWVIVFVTIGILV